MWRRKSSDAKKQRGGERWQTQTAESAPSAAGTMETCQDRGGGGRCGRIAALRRIGRVARIRMRKNGISVSTSFPLPEPQLPQLQAAAPPALFAAAESLTAGSRSRSQHAFATRLDPISEEATPHAAWAKADAKSEDFAEATAGADSCSPSDEFSDLNTAEIFGESTKPEFQSDPSTFLSRSVQATAGSSTDTFATTRRQESSPVVKLEAFSIERLASQTPRTQTDSSFGPAARFVDAADLTPMRSTLLERRPTPWYMCTPNTGGSAAFSSTTGNFLFDDPVIRGFLSGEPDTSGWKENSGGSASISFDAPTRDDDSQLSAAREVKVWIQDQTKSISPCDPSYPSASPVAAYAVSAFGTPGSAAAGVMESLLQATPVRAIASLTVGSCDLLAGDLKATTLQRQSVPVATSTVVQADDAASASAAALTLPLSNPQTGGSRSPETLVRTVQWSTGEQSAAQSIKTLSLRLGATSDSHCSVLLSNTSSNASGAMLSPPDVEWESRVAIGNLNSSDWSAKSSKSTARRELVPGGSLDASKGSPASKSSTVSKSSPVSQSSTTSQSSQSVEVDDELDDGTQDAQTTHLTGAPSPEMKTPPADGSDTDGLDVAWNKKSSHQDTPTQLKSLRHFLQQKSKQHDGKAPLDSGEKAVAAANRAISGDKAEAAATKATSDDKAEAAATEDTSGDKAEAAATKATAAAAAVAEQATAASTRYRRCPHGLLNLDCTQRMLAADSLLYCDCLPKICGSTVHRSGSMCQEHLVDYRVRLRQLMRLFMAEQQCGDCCDPCSFCCGGGGDCCCWRQQRCCRKQLKPHCSGGGGCGRSCNSSPKRGDCCCCCCCDGEKSCCSGGAKSCCGGCGGKSCCCGGKSCCGGGGKSCCGGGGKSCCGGGSGRSCCSGGGKNCCCGGGKGCFGGGGCCPPPQPQPPPPLIRYQSPLLSASCFPVCQPAFMSSGALSRLCASIGPATTRVGRSGQPPSSGRGGGGGGSSSGGMDGGGGGGAGGISSGGMDGEKIRSGNCSTGGRFRSNLSRTAWNRVGSGGRGGCGVAGRPPAASAWLPAARWTPAPRASSRERVSFDSRCVTMS